MTIKGRGRLKCAKSAIAAVHADVQLVVPIPEPCAAGDSTHDALAHTLDPGAQLAKNDRVAHAAHGDRLIPGELGRLQLHRVLWRGHEHAAGDANPALIDGRVFRLRRVEGATGLQ